MDSGERRVGPAPDVVARRLGDDTVLVNLRTNRIFQLNRTGAAFWELVEEGCERAEIEERLASRFAVDQAVLSSNLDALVAELDQAGLLQGDALA
jgi:hypothetical protein